MVPIRFLDKPKLLPNKPLEKIYNGYAARTGNVQSIILHSTNNVGGNTAFSGEAKFLYESVKVGVDFLVGAEEIVQYFNPREYYGFHAGAVRNSKFDNDSSIGIEVHYSPADKEQPINPKKIDNLTWLVRQLLKEYNLTPADISLHRLEAAPPGRKVDPSFWNNEQFEQWRGRLLQPMNTSTILNGPQIATAKLLKALNTWANHLTAEEKEAIAVAFTTYGTLTSVGNVRPFAQAAKETGWFASPRWKKSFNPAGLGADDTGAWGGHFNSAAEGILAQYAHLLCYAATEDKLTPVQQKIALLSPRRKNLIGAYGLGAANNTWIGLSLKWNSPKGNPNYGQEILDLAERVIVL